MNPRSLIPAPVLVAALLAVAHGAVADTVHTTDGSVLHGTVQGIAGGVLRLETAFAGALSIPLENVAGMATEQPRHVSLASGNVLVGELQYENGAASVGTALGRLDISRDSVVSLWADGEEDPVVVGVRKQVAAEAGKWTYEVTADVAGKSGNTDRSSYAGGVSATLARSADRLTFFAAGERVEDNNVKTSDDLRGGMDYERAIADRHSWYTRLLLEYDEVELLDLRTTAALGYGYHWLKSDTHQLRTRIGGLLRQEAYSDDRSEQSVGIDFGLHHMFRASEWVKLVTDVTYTPSIEDFADYRLNHESCVETPLGGSDLWRLRLGVGHRYNSLPAAGRDELDRSWFARLVLNLK